MTAPSRIVLAAHRALLRTSGTALGRVWALAYRAVARLGIAYLAWGERGAAGYIRAGSAGRDLLPGLSDVDLTLVLASDPAGPGRAAERARARWRRVWRRFGVIDLVLDHPRIFEESELRQTVGASALTYGLGEGRATYFGADASPDRMRMLERPGLYGTTLDWHRLTGPDRRPPEPARDAQARRIVAWLELMYWWQWVFGACVDPSGPRTAHLCVKLVAEPARIWLWLAHGERADGREEVLTRALRRLPEEEEALRRALALQRSLADSPAAPLPAVLPALIRLSDRIGRWLAADLSGEGTTEVKLVGGDLLLPQGEWKGEVGPAGDEPSALALCDWRSLVWPHHADDAFVPLRGDPADPTTLGALAAAHPRGPYPALRAGDLMVLPASRIRSRLRPIKCRVADPVTFAVAAGSAVAKFPNVAGWGAEDTASRAVAEHAARLAGPPPARGGVELGALFSAARAGLWWESLREREPTLALTAAAMAGRLAERAPMARALIEESLAGYAHFADRWSEPPRVVIDGVRELVLGLPAYRSAAARGSSETPSRRKRSRAAA